MGQSSPPHTTLSIIQLPYLEPDLLFQDISAFKQLNNLKSSNITSTTTGSRSMTAAQQPFGSNK